MKKFLIILCITVSIVILALCLEKIFYNSVILMFKYDYIIWCDLDECDYLNEKYGIDGKYNIIACKVSWNREKTQVYKIKELPYGIGQKKEISPTLSEYVRENSNIGEAIIKSILPYTIISILCSIVLTIMIKNITRKK